MSSGGRVARHAPSLPRSGKKYTKKHCSSSKIEGKPIKLESSRTSSKTSYENDIQCIGVFSPGEYRSPTLKRSKQDSFESPEVKKSHQSQSPKNSPRTKIIKLQDHDLQSPQSYGDRLKDIHLSIEGINFLKYEETPLVIKRGDLKSFFGGICNEQNIVLVTKLLSYRNRIVEITNTHGGPTNVLYSHRRYVRGHPLGRLNDSEGTCHAGCSVGGG